VTGGARVPTLGALLRYFLYLGSLGFGGPVALVGYMQRDLVERRRWFSAAEFTKGLALSQLAPGPLAAQLAICLGYAHSRIRGATLVALAFVLPSYAMTVALSMAYVGYGGLPWMRAAFYGVGAAVIGIIARAAYRLARLTLGPGRLYQGLALGMAVVTAWAEAEMASLFVLCGVAALLVEAPPAWVARLVRSWTACAWAVPLGGAGLPGAGWAAGAGTVGQLLWFFAQAGAFVFGSGLAIVPFLYGGVVQRHAWLTDQQFLDAVAVAMITPGPVVITVAFIGYLVAGQPGALAAAVGVFLPVYLFVVIPYPWFDRVSENPQVKAFVQGVTAAATGAIAGACVVLARRAVFDLPTFLLAAGTLALLARVRVPEPVIIAAAALAGIGIVAARGH
jgi:chromate transporter